MKASGMFTTTVTEVQRSEWSSVRGLVIDEISFMTESELMKLMSGCDSTKPVTWFLEVTLLFLVETLDNS